MAKAVVDHARSKTATGSRPRPRAGQAREAACRLNAKKLKPLVIGVGQHWRGDDAAGLDALALLEVAGEVDADLRPHHGEGLGLIALWEGRTLVIVLDAARSGAAPGTLHRVIAEAEDGGTRAMRCSSHVFGVHEAVRTARALGRMPGRLVLLAVEGEQWTLGEPLSEAVRASLPALVHAVKAELAGTPALDGMAQGSAL